MGGAQAPPPAKNFNPRSPRGGATRDSTDKPVSRYISIHAPHEGERRTAPLRCERTKLFQSTLPTRGSDGGAGKQGKTVAHFNPRSPRGGATRAKRAHPWRHIFQSTLPTRGSDPQLLLHRRRGHGISIHAPHEGERRGDCRQPSPRQRGISIHAPHEGERHSTRRLTTLSQIFQSTLPTRGSDMPEPSAASCSRTFQSTLPTRGSDPCHHPESQTYQHFNPRSPRGGATNIPLTVPLSNWISIHAPHEGERLGIHQFQVAALFYFNPRSPRGGATRLSSPSPASSHISIHAPHEGERHAAVAKHAAETLFQSTLPTRGSDTNPAHMDRLRGISIHAPHEGERPGRLRPPLDCERNFNPRSPRGGATG